MDAHKPAYQLRVRNVSLHRRGKPEHGTLYVTRHHLIFSYVPSTSKPGRAPSGQQQPSTLSADVSELDRGHGANENPHSQGDTASQAAELPRQHQSQQQQQKVRPKEIFVSYTMIQRCTLRLSVAQSNNRSNLSDNQTQMSVGDGTDEDKLFPPTVGTNPYGRSSIDSTTATTQPHAFASYSPQRPASPRLPDSSTTGSSRPPAIRIKCKDFNIFALHFHSGSSDKSADDHARQVFYGLRDRCCVHNMDDMYAYHFQPPAEELSTGGQEYDAVAEFARMGIRADAPQDGPGRVWRLTGINADYAYSTTYPRDLAVPRSVSDNILKYCGSFRSKARIPALAYLHPNGGSITRSSQPMVGVQGKRNPQDEKLVAAIFCSHTRSRDSPGDTPPNEPTNTTSSPGPTFIEGGSTVDVDIDVNHAPVNENLSKPRVYGSTRRNLIVDARPKINMIANKAAGGGIEDVANYTPSASDVPVEKIFLNIANIHVMRSSLEKVVEALGNADYIDLPPNQEALRKSGWLGHIANILDGAEMVARVVGLGASHALIHCSDGWDRTSQISALAQVMLDPHYRTLKGFITLVQKDFLAFGHKFRHRQGIEGSEKWFEVENERVQPGRAYQNGVPGDSSQLQAFGSKALSGARNWFEKNRSNLFRQPQSPAQSSSPESTSRPRTPPSNPILHSTPSPVVKEDKHKMDEKEVAPIFHQFLDAVYQLMHQEPTAFEFNERFLRRLFYHSYSGQYSEFLFNCERERSLAATKLPSVWAYFLARQGEFKNPEFVAIPDSGLIFPRRRGYEREVEVRWWSALYGRKDEEMNVPNRVLAVSEIPTSLSAQLSSVSLAEGPLLGTGDHAHTEPGAAGTAMGIKAARSTPALHTSLEDDVGDNEEVVEGNLRKSRSISSVISFDGVADPTGMADQNQVAKLDARFSIRNVQLPTQANDAWAVTPTKPSKSRATYSGDISAEPSIKSETRAVEPSNGIDESDPLGVSSKVASMPSNSRPSGLDFAAFAQQNAFSER